MAPQRSEQDRKETGTPQRSEQDRKETGTPQRPEQDRKETGTPQRPQQEGKEVTPQRPQQERKEVTPQRTPSKTLTGEIKRAEVDAIIKQATLSVEDGSPPVSVKDVSTIPYRSSDLDERSTEAIVVLTNRVYSIVFTKKRLDLIFAYNLGFLIHTLTQRSNLSRVKTIEKHNLQITPTRASQAVTFYNTISEFGIYTFLGHTDVSWNKMRGLLAQFRQAVNDLPDTHILKN